MGPCCDEDSEDQHGRAACGQAVPQWPGLWGAQCGACGVDKGTAGPGGPEAGLWRPRSRACGLSSCCAPCGLSFPGGPGLLGSWAGSAARCPGLRPLSVQPRGPKSSRRVVPPSPAVSITPEKLGPPEQNPSPTQPLSAALCGQDTSRTVPVGHWPWPPVSGSSCRVSGRPRGAGLRCSLLAGASGSPRVRASARAGPPPLGSCDGAAEDGALGYLTPGHFGVVGPADCHALRSPEDTHCPTHCLLPCPH